MFLLLSLTFIYLYHILTICCLFTRYISLRPTINVFNSKGPKPERGTGLSLGYKPDTEKTPVESNIFTQFSVSNGKCLK